MPRLSPILLLLAVVPLFYSSTALFGLHRADQLHRVRQLYLHIVMTGSKDQHQDQAGPQTTSLSTHPSSEAVLLSDVIGTDRSITIFSGLTRTVDALAKRLDDPSLNATVLAPRNAALQRLPRKPWEDARDYAEFGTEAYADGAGSDRAQQNLERFVNAHVIPKNPWREGDKEASLSGRRLWVEKKDGKTVVGLR